MDIEMRAIEADNECFVLEQRARQIAENKLKHSKEVIAAARLKEDSRVKEDARVKEDTNIRALSAARLVLCGSERRAAARAEKAPSRGIGPNAGDPAPDSDAATI
jgi:hypothetical protein